jgi:hypothetical protein
MLIPDPIDTKIRTAIDIKNALDRIHRLPALGCCPTKVREFRDSFQVDSEYDKDAGVYRRFKEIDDSPEVKEQVCPYRM